MDDMQILDLYFERSEQALSFSDERYGRYCRSIAIRILANAEDAEECVNSAYMRAWNSIPPARPASLKHFLGRIVRNLALNMHEKASALKRGGDEVSAALGELSECIPGDDLNSHIADDLTIKRVLDGFLSSLPAKTRKLFIRRYWHLEPIDELARAKTPYCTTRNRHIRAPENSAPSIRPRNTYSVCLKRTNKASINEKGCCKARNTLSAAFYPSERFAIINPSACSNNPQHP